MMIYPSNIKPIPKRPTRDHDQSRLDSARLNSTRLNSALLPPLLQLDSTSLCLTGSTNLDSLCFSTYYLLQRYLYLNPQPHPSTRFTSSFFFFFFSSHQKSLNLKTIHYTQPNLTWHITFDVCHLHRTRLPLFHVSTHSVWRLLAKWSACVATTDTRAQTQAQARAPCLPLAYPTPPSLNNELCITANCCLIRKEHNTATILSSFCSPGHQK